MSNQNQALGKIPTLRTYAQDLEDTRHAKSPSPRVVSIDETAFPNKVPARNKEPFVNKPTRGTVIQPISEKELVGFSKQPNTLVEKIIVDNEDAGEATVITDTKHNRFKLFPAIIISLNNWFSNQKKLRHQKAIPKYTLPQTTRRKGLIQRATSNTGKTATADFRYLQERIKHRSEEIGVAGKTIWTPDTEPVFLLLDEVRNSPVTDEKEEVAGKTIWTPDTEPVFMLLDEVRNSPVTNVIIEPKKSHYTEMFMTEDVEDQETDENVSVWENQELPEISQRETEPEESVSTWETEEVTVEIVQPEIVVPEEVTVEIVQPEIVVPEEVTVEIVQPEIVVPEEIYPPIPVVVETNVPEKQKVETQLIPPRPKLGRSTKVSFWRQLHGLNTNTLAFIISSFILIVIASIFVIHILLTRESSPNPGLSPAPESLLLNTNLNLIINSMNGRSNLINSLLALKTTRPEIVQAAYAEVFPSNNLVPPVEVLNLLGLDLEKNLAQSIEELRLGFTSEQEPFILMKVPDIIVAQGGLLLWEENMYTDLGKVFVLDPIAQSSDLNFSDSTFAGRDVRLIKQPSGSELIIYGLINNTVIITTTSSSYRELSILIK